MMSYQNYVIAAYVVFAVVLAWDYVAPRLQLRQHLHAAKSRAARVLRQAQDERTLPVQDMKP